jgi:sugar lactone lactonase YvrE
MVSTPSAGWPTATPGGTASLLAPLLALGATVPASAGDDPVVTEFDVVSAWPNRPAGIGGRGWVSGLAIDTAGLVWFCRKGPDPVQVYTMAGEFVRSWGRGLFTNPHFLRIGPDGGIWVSDFGTHVVQKFTVDGELLLTLGVRGEKGDDRRHFNMPTDMAFTPSGDVFVTDGYGNRRVVHFTREGRFVKAFGTAGPGPGQFVLPHALVVDSRGVLYVADRNSGRIQLFDQEGRFLDQWSNIIMPWGLWMTQDDRLWVCGSSPHWWYRHGQYPEYKDQIVMQFATSGRVLQMWALTLGDIGADKDTPETSRLRPGETVGAHCIAEDSQGAIYVGDIYGERAQKFVPIRTR